MVPKVNATDPEQHTYELSFVGARCNNAKDSDTYICQVDFVRKSAPQGWLGRWKRLSGLCKTAAPSRPA
jgi:hypothetical protein